MKPMNPWGWGGRNWALIGIGVNLLRFGMVPAIVVARVVAPPSALAVVESIADTIDRTSFLTFAVGAVCFLAWLRQAYSRALFVRSTPDLERRAKVLGIGFLHWYFVPLANLIVPYFAIATLDEQLEPNRMPLPPRRRGKDTVRGYRVGIPWREFVPRVVPRAPVAAWWAFFVMRIPFSFVSHRGTLAFVLACAVHITGLVLTLVVVWRISARLSEVVRRAKALARAASEAEDAIAVVS